MTTRFQLTFMVGLAIGRWCREHDIPYDFHDPNFVTWVDEVVNDAMSLTDRGGDFERDAAAEIMRLLGG